MTGWDDDGFKIDVNNFIQFFHYSRSFQVGSCLSKKPQKLAARRVLLKDI